MIEKTVQSWLTWDTLAGSSKAEKGRSPYVLLSAFVCSRSDVQTLDFAKAHCVYPWGLTNSFSFKAFKILHCLRSRLLARSFLRPGVSLCFGCTTTICRASCETIGRSNLCVTRTCPQYMCVLVHVHENKQHGDPVLKASLHCITSGQNLHRVPLSLI